MIRNWPRFYSIYPRNLRYLFIITASMSDDELQEPLIERLSASPELENGKSQKKRKRGAEGESKGEKLAKKPKTKKQKQQFVEDNLDMEAGINKGFAEMDSQLLADYVDQRTRQFESDLSAVELEDRHISRRCFPGSD